jgi:glycosyltransferase involved in cell wall biosynthesis
MRIAFIHDWLLGMRGGERCLEVLCSMFPEADIYTTFYRPERITSVITQRTVVTSALQRLPKVDRYYRHLLPFYPFAARSLEHAVYLNSFPAKYDLVLSVSHCLAKNVDVPRGTFHLCYCLTPMRYIWDQYDAYFSQHPAEPLIRGVAAGLRRWDYAASKNVDHFVGISDFVRERIRRVYGRGADVIYPPVRSDWIAPREPEEKGEGFLCVSALVPYKNVDKIVRAFNLLPYKLTIVGSGPERAKLAKIAGDNVAFLSGVPDRELAALYRRSRAMVFAAEEDFGMTPVEMQAAGRPVICYGKGGSLETVSVDHRAPTGVYFHDLAPESIAQAVEDFLSREESFTVENCVKHAEKFSPRSFKTMLVELFDSLGFPLVQPMEPPKIAARM